MFQWFFSQAARWMGPLDRSLQEVAAPSLRGSREFSPCTCKVYLARRCVRRSGLQLVARGRPHLICANFVRWGRCPAPGSLGRISQFLLVNYKNNALYKYRLLAPARRDDGPASRSPAAAAHTATCLEKYIHEIRLSCACVREWRYRTMLLQGWIGIFCVYIRFERDFSGIRNPFRIFSCVNRFNCRLSWRFRWIFDWICDGLGDIAFGLIRSAFNKWPFQIRHCAYTCRVVVPWMRSLAALYAVIMYLRTRAPPRAPPLTPRTFICMRLWIL